MNEDLQRKTRDADEQIAFGEFKRWARSLQEDRDRIDEMLADPWWDEYGIQRPRLGKRFFEDVEKLWTRYTEEKGFFDREPNPKYWSQWLEYLKIGHRRLSDLEDIQWSEPHPKEHWGRVFGNISWTTIMRRIKKGQLRMQKIGNHQYVFDIKCIPGRNSSP